MSSVPTKEKILDAALALLTRRGGANVTMAEIARAAHVSRQALYLHFADRAELFVALVRHSDVRRGLDAELRQLDASPSGVDALRFYVSLQARLNPGIWPLARAFDAVRRHDAAAERSWQDRLTHRLEGTRGIIARLADDGALRPGIDRAAAADLLWTLTSLRTWEDLVVQRQWSAARYQRHLTSLLLDSLTTAKRPITRTASARKRRR